MAGSGEVITYRELDERSNRLAHLLYSFGLRRGDHIAILAENHPRYYEVYWAAMRSGLYLTAINRYFSPEEIAYVVNDSETTVLIATLDRSAAAAAALELIPRCPRRLMMDGVVGGFQSYEEAVAPMPDSPLDEEWRGEVMLYSSGTTGHPKGIKRPLRDARPDEPGVGIAALEQGLLGMDADTVYLSPAPLYHSAPLMWSTGLHEFGGTTVVMESFDETAYLAYVEKYSITHSQLVPTMFIRMLKLPEEVRQRFDLSSLQRVTHAAAPCPAEIKRQMIDWWGPIVTEYYAGTESHGLTFIDSEQWLTHQGSVGTAILGKLHICADDGTEVGTGETGLVYFENEKPSFEYHRDEKKTREGRHPEHDNWATLGDIGYVDEEGFLYLTDRKAFMIISGGVNIYPQEVEDCLVLHDKVADVAVFGLPDPEMGEFVQAVVQPAEGVVADEALEQELREYTRSHIAHFKVPRVIDFRPELPRLPTGKLYKRLLREEYLAPGL